MFVLYNTFIAKNPYNSLQQTLNNIHLHFLSTPIFFVTRVARWSAPAIFYVNCYNRFWCLSFRPTFGVDSCTCSRGNISDHIWRMNGWMYYELRFYLCVFFCSSSSTASRNILSKLIKHGFWYKLLGDFSHVKVDGAHNFSIFRCL